MSCFIASLRREDLAAATVMRGYRYDLRHFLAWHEAVQGNAVARERPRPATISNPLAAKRPRCPNRTSRDPTIAEVSIASNTLTCFFAGLGLLPLLGGSGGLAANPVTPPSSPRHPVSRIALGTAVPARAGRIQHRT